MNWDDPLPMTFREALQTALRILNTSERSASPGANESEAEQLVLGAYRWVTGQVLSRIDFFTRILQPLPPPVAEKLVQLSHERARGVPLQYLIGWQTFLDHEYRVGPEVLIPRPETEILVRTAIATLSQSVQPPVLGLEVGLGSGAISIELLSYFAALKMLSSEVSPGAREVARDNAKRILGDRGQDRLQICSVSNPMEVCEPFLRETKGRVVDFLMSNPPYLSHRQEVEEQVFLFEPHLALFAPDQDPLYFYRKIEHDASRLLKDRGHVFLEVPHERASEIQKLFSPSNWDVQVLPDLNQRDRVLMAQLKDKTLKDRNG